jgi:hypothetical protein
MQFWGNQADLPGHKSWQRLAEGSWRGNHFWLKCCGANWMAALRGWMGAAPHTVWSSGLGPPALFYVGLKLGTSGPSSRRNTRPTKRSAERCISIIFRGIGLGKIEEKLPGDGMSRGSFLQARSLEGEDWAELLTPVVRLGNLHAFEEFAVGGGGAGHDVAGFVDERHP